MMKRSYKMDDLDPGIDLAGLGKVAKAIPAKSWNKLVDTACKTFTDVLAPVTASSVGVGKLIEVKFVCMSEIQKIYAAEAMEKARKKISSTGHNEKGNPKATVLLKAVENASIESDDNLREIWANLIANEIINNSVHPDFPNILERLSSRDAITLAEIAEKNSRDKIKRAAKAFVYEIIIRTGISTEEETEFSHVQLKRLDLVTQESGQWKLTITGREFLMAVTDPVRVND
jgi:hypothetical protein